MDKQEILLKEYELCLQDIIDTSSRYWTIVNIFMAANMVVLGAIVAGVISASFIKEAFVKPTPPQILVAGSVLIVLGLGMIIILISLKKYLKRANFLSAINYERMREIEFDLRIWKNWRVHGIDNWDKPSKISSDDRSRLTEYHPEKWWQGWRKSKEYATSNKSSNRWPIFAMIAIWGVIVLAASVAIVWSIVC
jgi:hypothetical protein